MIAAVVGNYGVNALLRLLGVGQITDVLPQQDPDNCCEAVHVGFLGYEGTILY